MAESDNSQARPEYHRSAIDRVAIDSWATRLGAIAVVQLAAQNSAGTPFHQAVIPLALAFPIIAPLVDWLLSDRIRRWILWLQYCFAWVYLLRWPSAGRCNQCGKLCAVQGSTFRAQTPRHQRITAFCACSRFSASSQITDCGPSMTSLVTSSSRCAGRQCMNSASGFASAIRPALT